MLRANRPSTTLAGYTTSIETIAYETSTSLCPITTGKRLQETSPLIRCLERLEACENSDYPHVSSLLGQSALSPNFDMLKKNTLTLDP
ncbi:hypothetical protein BDZ45DRAFT_669698 [Acephala macrosclerotiorum]|nr:hypothetical protein BDZ45DRAFT_669698 [Acephala macrosclerotiorum]